MPPPPSGHPWPVRASTGLAHALAGALAFATAAALAFPEWFERPALWAWGCGTAWLLILFRWACTASVAQTTSEDNSR